MSNILYRELRSTYFWLRTYIPWTVARKSPVLTKIVRGLWRRDMRENRVWRDIFRWLSGRHVD